MNFGREHVQEALLTPSQIDKIGNALIYLSEGIRPLSKTKALKLLYLTEEISIKKNGMPFFGVDFQLWKFGPVIREVYVDLTAPGDMFNKFIATNQPGESDAPAITAKQPFNDDEFSDCDLEVLATVVASFKDKTAAELVSITHRAHFPWYETAKKNGYLELFQNGRCNTTDIGLDLSMLLDDEPERNSFYLSTLEHQRQSNYLNGF